MYFFWITVMGFSPDVTQKIKGDGKLKLANSINEVVA